MSRVSKLKEQRPEVLSNPEIYQLAEQADIIHELKALYDSKSGKQLVKLLIGDAINVVHNLRSSYKTATHTELIALIALMDASISTAKLLMEAKEVNDVINSELEEALRE